MNTSEDGFTKLAAASEEGMTQADATLFNQTYAASCAAADEGVLLKGASAIQTKAIMRRLREKPFFRNVLPPQDVSDRHLDRALEHDLPRVIEEMEPSFRKPRAVPFGQAPETTPVRGHKFEVIFYELQTPEFIFQIDRLKTWRMDLRQTTTDAMLMDLGELEDKQALSLVDRCVGQASGLGLAGVNQHNIVAGPIARGTWKNVKSNLQDRQLNVGVTLMNRRTASEFEAWPRNEIGGDLAQAIFTDGAKALGKFTPGGLPSLVTINAHLVPNNWVYQFTEPGYLGRFYIWEDVQVFVERKRDFIRQSAKTKIGITLANTNGLHLTRFQQSS